jgi:hypothetical protein
MHPIVFPLHRGSIGFLATMFLALAVAGLGLILFASKSDQPIAAAVFGGAVAVAFGLAGASMLRRVLRNEDVLTVTSHGFEAVGAAPVSWFEVEGIQLVSISLGRRGVRSTVIAVGLHDPEAYLIRADKTAAKVAQGNLDRGLSPINVSADNAKGTIAQMFEAMKIGFVASGAASVSEDGSDQLLEDA